MSVQCGTDLWKSGKKPWVVKVCGGATSLAIEWSHDIWQFLMAWLPVLKTSGASTVNQNSDDKSFGKFTSSCMASWFVYYSKVRVFRRDTVLLLFGKSHLQQFYQSYLPVKANFISLCFGNEEPFRVGISLMMTCEDLKKNLMNIFFGIKQVTVSK